MILSMSEQARLFFISVVFGFFIGFGYDWLRVFRRIIKHFNFFIQLEDILYWLFSALLLFLVMLMQNYGEIRFFLILGDFIGMILYFCIVSPLFLSISMAVVNLIKKILALIFKAISFPFKIFAKFLKIPYHFLDKCIKKTIKNFNLLLKNNPFCAKIEKYRKKINLFNKFLSKKDKND